MTDLTDEELAWARSQTGTHWDDVRMARGRFGVFSNPRSFVITPAGRVRPLSPDTPAQEIQALQQDVDKAFWMAERTGLLRDLRAALEARGMGRHPAIIATGDVPANSVIGGTYFPPRNMMIVPRNGDLSGRASVLVHEWTHMLVAMRNGPEVEKSLMGRLANEALAYAHQLTGEYLHRQSQEGARPGSHNISIGARGHDYKRYGDIFDDVLWSNPDYRRAFQSGTVPEGFVAHLRNELAKSPTSGHINSYFGLRDGQVSRVTGPLPQTDINNDGLTTAMLGSPYARTFLRNPHARHDPANVAAIAAYNHDLKAVQQAIEGGRFLHSKENFDAFLKHYLPASARADDYTGPRKAMWEALQTQIQTAAEGALQNLSAVDPASIARMAPAERERMLHTLNNAQEMWGRFHKDTNPDDARLNPLRDRLDMWVAHDRFLAAPIGSPLRREQAQNLVRSFHYTKLTFQDLARDGETALAAAQRTGFIEAVRGMDSIRIGKNTTISGPDFLKKQGLDAGTTAPLPATPPATPRAVAPPP